MPRGDVTNIDEFRRNRAPKPEGSHRADGSHLDDAWRKRAWESFNSVDETQMRRIIEEMQANHGEKMPMGGNRREAPEPKIDLSSFGPRQGSYRYDAYNDISGGGGGGDEGPPEAPDGGGGRGGRPPRRPTRGGGREGGDGGGFDPGEFDGTPYANDAHMLQVLAGRGDWEAVDHLKSTVLDKIGNDRTTGDRGQALYEIISDTLQSYVADQGERRRMRQTDPRAHFSEEKLAKMAEISPEGDVAREQEFNALFSRADTQPSRPFQEVFNSFYDEPIYNAFIENLQGKGSQLLKEGRAAGDRDMIVHGEKLLDSAQKYILEYTYRGLIHDANYLIAANLGIEQMAGFMSRFSVEMADNAFRKKGVTPAMHFYEQALVKVKEENNGYLPYDLVVAGSQTGRYSRVEELARKYFKQSLDAGFLEDASGNKLTNNNMQDWEIDRAMAFARGLGIITGRFVEIAASSRLPDNKYISMWAHNLIAGIAPFRHSIGKFNIGNNRNRFLMYMMDADRRGFGKKWDMEELRKVDDGYITKSINGLLPDEEQRLMGKVNPFEIGGILTRSTWRVGGNPDSDVNADPLKADTKASAIGKLVENSRSYRANGGEANSVGDPFERIGKGVIIEKNRYILSNAHASPADRAKAEKVIRRELKEIAKTLPTKILFNVKEARDLVLQEFGGDAFLREDFRNALDTLIVVQEKAVVEGSSALDFSFVANSPEKQLAQRIARFVGENYGGSGQDTQHLDYLVGDFRDRKWKVPYVFGTEDVPWDKYEFARTGGRSIERRWKDMLAASKAGAALTNLVNKMPFISSPGDLVNALHEIHTPIEEYDAGIAEAVVKDLAEGLIWFYSKDKGTRGIAGEVVGKISGKASFAEAVFGRGAMSWDELTTKDFIDTLKQRDMIADHEKVELMEKTKSQGRHVALRLGEYAAYIILVAILMRSTTQAFKSSAA